MKISGIINESIVDGPGIRFVIFAQGCQHHCPGCHNPQTHDIGNGYEISIDEIILKIKKSRLTSGVTFSGGEPFLQAKEFFHLAKKIKELKYHIISYTGYTFEEILLNKNKYFRKLLEISDILIDGKFILGQKSIDLKFRGSKNQRIILPKKSLACGKIIETEF